jgi:HPt (histidine-containing phosphotransfer) domain-containing protein
MANNQPTYDLSQLIAISNGNELFVKKMVDIFCDQTPLMLKTMLDAYQAGDLKRMAEIAHKIKPSIDNLKITSVTQRIREIEKTGSRELENVSLEEILFETETMLTDVISRLKKEYEAK